MPVEIGKDYIKIDDKIIEMGKSIGQTHRDAFEPTVVLYTERMYPPIRNVSSTNHLISGQSYGNGLYVISFTNPYSIYQPFNCFNTNDGIGGHWADGAYTNGIYNSTNNIVSGYNGEWLKIKFPIAINLTKYALKTREGYQTRAPQDFKIYGSNDEINWVELTNITNAVYVNNNLYERTIITTGTYNSFGLVVNKLFAGATVLNFDEWFIYSKEIVTTDSSLIIHYKFDGIAQNNSSIKNYGSLGSSHDGSLTITNNGIFRTIGETNPYKLHWTTKVDSNHNNWINLPSNLLDSINNEFTISWTAKDYNLGDKDYTIFFRNQSETGIFMRAHLKWSDNNIYWDIGQGINTSVTRLTSGFIHDNLVSNWVLTKEISGSNMIMKIWRNGLLLTSNNVLNITWVLGGINSIKFGVNDDSDISFRDKSIENLRIYNRALYQNEIISSIQTYEVSLPNTIEVKNIAELATNVNGWRLVRYLPATIGRWYSGNDNLEGLLPLNIAYNYANEWSIPFGVFNEFCFSTFNFKKWLYCTRDSVLGELYNNQQRPIIKSSSSDVPYRARWYNRINNPEDPLVSVEHYGTDLLYAENGTVGNPTNIIPTDGGMCVWVRSSKDYLPLLLKNEDNIEYTDYKYILFKNTGEDQTEYTVNFPDETDGEVLIIGGGGGGGMDMGGGGGAGGFIKLNNQVFNGTYTIKVGKGGDGAPAAGTNGQPGAHQYTINAKNGKNSEFGNNIAIGGGYGGSSVFSHQLAGQGSNGGSGGGSSGYEANNTSSKAGVGTVGQGFSGGFGLQAHHSGGGGGAGSIGGGSPSNAAGAAKGGDGIYSDILGIGYFWAGGGGGSGYSTTGGNGGLGGGGGGSVNATFGGTGYNNGEPGGGGSINSWANTPGGNAGQHTGGGGGGGSHYNSNNKGGNGGSGIVIIRYKYSNKLLSITVDQDYNYFALTNTFGNQEEYSINFPNDTECDILMIGGGGGGGTSYSSFSTVPGGGGGAGGLIFLENQNIPTGIYTIRVGKGGDGDDNTETINIMRGKNGENTSFSYHPIEAIGGGGGGSRDGVENGGNGGSGGGATWGIGGGYSGGTGLLGQGFDGGSTTNNNIAPTYVNISSIYAFYAPMSGDAALSYIFGFWDAKFRNTRDLSISPYISMVNGNTIFSVNNPLGVKIRWKSSANSGIQFRYMLLNSSWIGIGSTTAWKEIDLVDGSQFGLLSGEGIQHELYVLPMIDTNIAAGGGGSGEIGKSNNDLDSNISGDGGIGKFVINTFNFKEKFGLSNNPNIGELFNGNVYFAGGGGCGLREVNNSFGGKGGGGSSSTDFILLSDIPKIGGGGSGGGRIGNLGISKGGNGGSGIVVIRYKLKKSHYNAQWTYNSTNPSVYHLGNVGIGTTNPTNALDVVGSISIIGDISALSKTFKIEHPMNTNKWLYHGCVEGPRFDNIYRGKKLTINGNCEVDIDKECNTTGGMSKGTFVALNTNCSLYITNNQTYDRVNGSINDGKITINCENIIDHIEIDWLVIGERQDDNVINIPITNHYGNLICEHDKIE